MFRLKDLVLIGMAVTGILGGVFMPKLAGFFTPAVLYLMMKISAVDMSLMLLKVIFIPLGAALLVKKTMPGGIIHFNRIAFPLSLTIFLLINLGIFSRYSGFLKAHQDQLAISVGVACLCALAYVLIAILVALLSKRRMGGLTGAVSLLYVNNVLAVVFGGQFFGPKTPLLAAVYMLPVFLMLLPLRMLSGLNLETQAK